MSPEIRTRSGKYVHLECPDPRSIDIADIAFALAHINRFTGHVGMYSVAQHSVLCSHEVHPDDDETALHALLHDASEAYLGDVSTPLKRLLRDYAPLEAKMQATILRSLGIVTPCPAIVHEIDRQLLCREMETFWEGKEWITPERSEKAFLSRFRYLNDRRWKKSPMLSGVVSPIQE